MKIEDILFDEDDRTLFLIDDIQLKADAIRYSILPKLGIVNNELISRITEFYAFDFFKDYSIAQTPHFRLAKTQRKAPTKRDYTHASISITGQRKDDKWLGLDKGTGIVPKISPTQLSIDLDSVGLSTFFYFNHPKNFTKDTYEKFFSFFKNEIEHITGLAFKAELKYNFEFIDAFSVLHDLQAKLDLGLYDVIFHSAPITYPIDYNKINGALLTNLFFFPVLNACKEIALGNTPDLTKDIAILEDKIPDYLDKYFTEIPGGRPNLEVDEETLADIKQRADTKIKIQAGIRWQVFKRDNWKCLACGRCAEDDIILHVDHILPRSKGGKDELENFQTLCDLCNIGKSNKDSVDLRKSIVRPATKTEKNGI